MKKVMLMVAFMVAAVAASAQVYIGGGLGVNTHTPAHHEDDDPDAVTKFSIIPEIGYNLDDKWTVGIGIGYEYMSNSRITTEFRSIDFDKMNGFVIAPYARYHFVKWNNVSLFVQGGLSYTWGKATVDGDKDAGIEDYEATMGTFEIGFKPGVKVDLSEKISFVATVGNLGWETTSYGGDIKNVDASSTFDFGVDLSSINFAMYYNF